MQIMSKIKAQLNTLLTAGFILFLLLITWWRFDYFYALNDDTMMKDIMAGVLTGNPEGHTIQMLYPISVGISLFYKAARNIPWYAVFLCGCHFCCFFLLGKRMLCLAKTLYIKIIILLAEGIFIASFFLWETVFMQYTVTSGMLAATAAFLFYTTSQELPWKDYLKQNIPSILLVLLAYSIRTEMLLLLFPFIGMLGVFKWSEEKKIFTKENAKKYFSILGIMLAGMFLLFVMDELAYQSKEWKTFNRFFDARTQVYDFYGIPSYEENKEFYDSILLSKEEHNLLGNYNFSLEEKIDAPLLEQIQEYAQIKWNAAHPFKERFKESIWIYRYGERSERETALLQVTIASYFVLLLAGISTKSLSYFWKAVVLFVIRSGLWIFIIYRNRAPERITHPLYLMELVIIAAMLFNLYRNSKLTKIMVVAAFSVITLFGISNINASIDRVKQETTRCEQKNEEYIALQEYTKESQENLYFFDVMSTIYYNEKAFKNTDNTYSNIAYLGGWISKSPLTAKKLQKYPYATETQALLEGQNTYYLCRAEKSPNWLSEYFAAKGITVEIEEEKVLVHNGLDTFKIYNINITNDASLPNH